MGKFSGYLICSDIDGTFYSPVPDNENIQAVRYFIENGGKFTFATGRMVDHLREKGFLPIINAPVCLCNGGAVYDYSKEEIVLKRPLDYTLQAFLDAISQIPVKLQRLHIYYSDMHGSADYNDIGQVSDTDRKRFLAKIMCRFETQQQADDFKAAALQMPFFSQTYICKSFSVGVEFNACNATKGHALRFIKEYLGDIHTSVGVGNYENDLTLLQHADLAVAVENAEDSLKDIADLVIRPYTQYSFKELIEHIEAKL